MHGTTAGRSRGATPAAVLAEDLVVSFGATNALAGLSFELAQGVHALLGPNGAGKTTALRVLATAQPLTAGRTVVAGCDLGSASPAELRDVRGRIGYLPQDNPLVPHLRAVDMVAYAGWLRGMARADARRAARERLEQVGLTAHAKKRCSRLSGGMKRRVGLACALVHGPSLLLLDEPTAGLDPQQRLGFDRVVAAAAADMPVVISTHMVNELVGLAPRVFVVDAGRVRFDGSLDDLEALAPTRLDTPGSSAVERGYFHVLERSGVA